ncbi:glomulin-like isoform X1 [Ornithodoros turicata]|uniref:glomulin-like isoform X1 n=1 Tax=Ornithodoros turicata TaxID=34597 RepID=UPI003139C053
MTSQYDSAVRSITDHLASRDFASARSVICDDQHRALIYDCAWDLVLPALLALEEDKDCERSVNTDDGQCLFKEIINRGKPKEVLLSLVEHLSEVKSISVLATALEGVQSILLSMPTKKRHFLQWALPSIEKYLTSLPDPQNQPLEDDTQRVLLDADPAVQMIVGSLKAVHSFLEPFIQEVSLARGSARDVQLDILEQRKQLQNHLLSLLGRCGVLHTYSPPEKPESNSHACAESLVHAVAHLSSDLAALSFSDAHKDCKNVPATCDKSSGDHFDEDEDSEDERVLHIAQICPATLAYLLYAEFLAPESVPCVYSQRYIFEKNLGNVIFLLSHAVYVVNYKGIALCDAIVARQSRGQYSSLDLDNSALTTLFRQLLKVMVTCPWKDVRERSVRVFCSYLKLFDAHARYSVYCCLLKREEHAGVRGFLVDRYRSDLHQWNRPPKESENPFGGCNIVNFLRIVCVLPEREETDLLNYSDCILAVLNLLRYIALTSLKPSSHDVVNSVLRMAEVYGEQLKKGLDLSRAHYTLNLKQVEDKVAGELKDDSDSMLLGMGLGALPNLPPEQEIEVMKSALARFDLMESVLVLAQDSLKLVSGS